MTITRLTDGFALPKEARAVRVLDDNPMPGASVISRNSPIPVAARGDESLENPHIDGYIMSEFSDPLSESAIADAPSLATRPTAKTASEPVTDSRTPPAETEVKVVAVGERLSTPTVARKEPPRLAKPVSQNQRFIPASDLKKEGQAAVPVTPTPVQSALPKRIPIQIKNASFGVFRVKADFVSISDTVVAIGYIQTEDSNSYEPPTLPGEQRLKLVIGDQTYTCASLGISFECDTPGISEKVLWVVLVRDLE